MDKIAKSVFPFSVFERQDLVSGYIALWLVFLIFKTKHLFMTLLGNIKSVVLILQQVQSYKKFCLPSDHCKERNGTVDF